jgi:hypothetical protein
MFCVGRHSAPVLLRTCIPANGSNSTFGILIMTPVFVWREPLLRISDNQRASYKRSGVANSTLIYLSFSVAADFRPGFQIVEFRFRFRAHTVEVPAMPASPAPHTLTIPLTTAYPNGYCIVQYIDGHAVIYEHCNNGFKCLYDPIYLEEMSKEDLEKALGLPPDSLVLGLSFIVPCG